MKAATALVLVLLMAGCASSSPTVNLSYTNRIDLPEMPRPMTLLEVEWNVQNIDTLITMLQQFGVITDAEAIQFRARLVNNPNNQTFAQFALDGKNYESMAVNQAELRRFLEQQRIVIDYFIQATEPTRTQTVPNTRN
jgi:hypothetical protein